MDGMGRNTDRLRRGAVNFAIKLSHSILTGRGLWADGSFS